jgi:predicted RND superfamily exporter protein
MKTLKTKIDDGFAASARLFYQNPWKTVICVFGLIAILATQLANIKIDTSTEGLLHQSDPALVDYHQFRHQFGRDQLLIIALHDEDIFHPVFLETLRDLHHDLESRVPHVEEITSLINARNTRGEQDRLIVEDLFADWPESSSALDRIKQRTLANPLYRNILVSEDHKYTAILIKTNNYAGQDATLDLSAFDSQPTAAAGSGAAEQLQFITEKENSETVEAVLSVVQQYRDKGLEAYVAGSSAVTHCFAKAVVRDLSLFMGSSLLVIATILYLLFRRLSAVFLPLLVVMLSLIATVSLMAANDIAIKMPTQVLPSFLMAVGVGYAVHILALFYHRHQNGIPKENALVASVRHAGLPVTLTAVTTAGGLLSFVSADVAPIANLGIFAGIGTIMVLVFVFSLLPPLVALLPIQTRSQARPSGKGFMSMAESYIISFIVITVLMILLLGHVRTGLLSMVPNLMPIVVTLGIMGWIGKPLNLFTIMIGSIAIGLAVDDTIHFMHNFRKYQIRSGDAEWAVRETFLTAGRAMLATSCVLSCGFFIFMFARMKNFFDFGLLTGFAIIMALVADFFLSPALVIAVQRWTAKKRPASAEPDSQVKIPLPITAERRAALTTTLLDASGENRHGS